MTRVCLMSDSHGYMDSSILQATESCDEIWHAGDIGNEDFLKSLHKSGKPIRAVYGNIDSHSIRAVYPEDLIWTSDGVKTFMTHIGGSPGRYSARVRKIIEAEQPGLFICGHSHILKVIYDKENQLLHINPGACGKEGFHVVRTMIRFTLDEGKVKDLEVIELGKRGK